MASAVLAALGMPAAAQGPLQFQELTRMGLPLAGPSFGGDVTYSVALGDVDGDGDLDMVIGNGPGMYGGGQNRLLLNDGEGTFLDATASQMPADIDNTNSVAIGDVDGDGDLDVVLGNSGRLSASAQNRLYLNDGAGTFSDATANQMPTDIDNTNSVALGDVDGDGDLDLVIGNEAGNVSRQNRLYLNDGAGTFRDFTPSQMPLAIENTNSVALGDLDLDGDLDMVLGNSGQNRLYLNDGGGSFSDVTASQMPVDGGHTTSVALGDVDGDGDLDMVLGNGFPAYQNRLYLNNGRGAFSDATASQMPVGNDDTLYVACGDVDGDGDLDMAFGNWVQNRFHLNDGSGLFIDATGSRMPQDSDRTFSVAFGDVDGDGDLDTVCGNGGYSRFGGPNRLYLNLQRQLHAPAAPQIGQPYTLDAYLRYGPSSTVDLAAAYVSTASASIPWPFGTLGIDLRMAVSFPTLVIPQPVGVGTATFPIPNASSLIGLGIYSQAVLVAVPNDVRLSNVVRDVIQ